MLFGYNPGLYLDSPFRQLPLRRQLHLLDVVYAGGMPLNYSSWYTTGTCCLGHQWWASETSTNCPLFISDVQFNSIQFNSIQFNSNVFAKHFSQYQPRIYMLIKALFLSVSPRGPQGGALSTQKCE